MDSKDSSRFDLEGCTATLLFVIFVVGCHGTYNKVATFLGLRGLISNFLINDVLNIQIMITLLKQH
jgi:hypothetical protein